MRFKNYRIKLENIFIITTILLFIFMILDIRYLWSLVLYNPQHKGLTVIIKVVMEFILLVEKINYIIEKKQH